jgi:hypothetical protein
VKNRFGLAATDLANVDDYPPPSCGVGRSGIHAAERDWPIDALGGIVAQFEAANVAKARQGGRQPFFTAVFFGAVFSRNRSKPNPACPHGQGNDPAPLRRSLIQACRTATQNPREPALGLRDALAIAADVTSLPVYGGWVRRSRRAMRRIHPYRRHYQKPCDKQTDDSDKYPTFGFHFPPPWLNRYPPDDPVQS